ncbi:Polyketide cyclase / dehydrase and lipid transport [Stigmatella aurantiaca]|uniref:Polyketide cyclase / dehydrase and lipid transport n=1 Tax=Stigmatella aurantiaca TaxID=41 RepID=A0A1H7Y3Q1_STIAU|nr:SRPBCC family protein [Stigmatella aurantiaca]SEM40846.1 Polyketide cyclase / dehydrase and lipid transport [Stigmatella aurantiaca]
MKVTTSATIDIECSPEQVYDFVTSEEAPAKTFEGTGRIPGVVRTEVVGGGPLREGATCRVHGTDGAVMERLITVLDRPRRHEYQLASGFKKPLSWLLRSGHGVWTFAPNTQGGTHLEWVYVFELTTPLVYPVVSALIKGSFHQSMVRCLQRTRECLVPSETRAAS